MKKIILFASLIISVSAYSQKINNQITFQKGQKLEITTQMNRSSTQEIMGRSMESTISATYATIYDVNDVTNNTATIESKVKRIKFDMSLFGRNENFDSDNAEDMKDGIGKMMSKSLESKYTMTVDAAGAVNAVKQDDEKNKKAKSADAAEGMMGMMMGRMGMGGAPKAGDATIFKILPNKEIGKGESWVEESNDEAGAKKTNYLITDITETEILIDFTEESTLVTKQQMMGQEAAIDMKAKSNGKIILDKATHLLKQKTFVTTSEETINAAGMTMPSSSKITTTITVKAV